MLIALLVYIITGSSHWTVCLALKALQQQIKVSSSTSNIHAALTSQIPSA